jgi:hypothetical protein
MMPLARRAAAVQQQFATTTGLNEALLVGDPV